METAGEGFLLMDENMKIVDLNAAYSSEVILSEIFHEYTQFIQGSQAEDDVTLVAIKTTQ